MPASYSKQLLGGSTNGKGIKITATTNGGANTIHTAVTGSTDFDEIWLYATNTSANYTRFHVLYGGTTEPDNEVEVDVPPGCGPVLIIPGWVLNGGLLIKGYADSASVIIAYGFVNRVTTTGS